MLGVTEKRLADWRYQGTGPVFIRLGHRTVRYKRDDISLWIEAHTESPAKR